MAPFLLRQRWDLPERTWASVGTAWAVSTLSSLKTVRSP